MRLALFARGGLCLSNLETAGPEVSEVIRLACDIECRDSGRWPTAEGLKISRKNLWEKMRKLNIDSRHD